MRRFVFGQPTFVFGAPKAAELCALAPGTEESFARIVGGIWARMARRTLPAAGWPVFSAGDEPQAVLSPVTPTGLAVERRWRTGYCFL